MKNRILLIGLFILLTKILDAQTVYLTEDEKDIYWQPNSQIDFSDYQSLNKEDCHKYNEKYGWSMSSSIGFRGIVDIPKKRGKCDKFYIAPVFCKRCSCILSEDSLSLKVDRLLFDVAEFCARNARKELLAIQKEMNSDNTCTMYFTTVKNKWDEKMRSIFGTVIEEILVEKKDSAYTSWRKTIDDVLLQTNNYATQPIDCYRLIINEPIEKGYQKALNIVGDLRNKKEEKKE
jgi:cyclophilin family peptidyl-prolyl cis-trans isomerase